MPQPDKKQQQRRPMHRRTIECQGYLRDDGLWEIEARLIDTKPFAMQDRFRGPMQAGDPIHEICLRLAIDDEMTIREAETSMLATPYPTCIHVQPLLARLVGEKIGKGWRDLIRQKIGRLEGCTHVFELLATAATALFQTMSFGKNPEGGDSLRDQAGVTEQPYFIHGCYSWRTDGPIVAEVFPQFATGPKSGE